MNNVQIWFCNDKDSYMIFDKSLEKGCYPEEGINIYGGSQNNCRCTDDVLVKSNISKKEAKKLILILRKLNPRKWNL